MAQLQDPIPQVPLRDDPTQDAIWKRWLNGLKQTIAPLGPGTVTSVAQTVPSEFNVAGSPITSSGTLAITKANQNANLVWAGPAMGAAAQPTFRSLVAADVPAVTNIVVADAAGDTTTFPILSPDATGSIAPLTDAGLTYNASTNALTTTTFIGALTGNASSATTAGIASVASNVVVADAASDTTTFPMLSGAATGASQPVLTDAGLTYNASTNVLTVTGPFTGPHNGTLGATTPNTAVVTTLTVNTNANPDANDGAALGTTALGWSDLFLASGGVIDWANNGARLTHANPGVNQVAFTGAGGAVFLISNATNITVGGISNINFQVKGANETSGGASLWGRFVNSASGFSHKTVKSRNTTPGSFTIVAADDSLGAYQWFADDGVDYASEAARIEAFVDGTPGSNDMPGRLVFSTTADGAAAVTSRWIINNAGHFLSATDNSWDIGASGATRPRTVYAATSFVGGTGTFTDLTSTGNTILGDAAADTLTVNAETVSQPNIPCVLAYNGADDTNQTGAGAVATVDFDTEIFDQSGDFAADTFTAPSTGKYLISVAVRAQSIPIGATAFVLSLVTSNRTYNQSYILTAATATVFPQSIVVIADMDAMDTASATLQISGGAGDTATITGGTTIRTYFCCVRVA